MPRVTEYEWTVQLRHAVQGYGKRYTVRATDYAGAVGAAMLAVHDAGYEPDGFQVIALTRGAITRSQ